jgi:hypothetical protein
MPTIGLGTHVLHGKEYWVDLPWNTGNGILIAGQSGSGKSQTAAFYLNQYAYHGAKIIICDYDSPDGDQETLSERVKHLSGSFALPAVTSPEAIQERMEWLSEEYARRREDNTRRHPLILVIDEVSAFLSYINDEDPSAIESFARDLLLMRKVGIRAMIIGQEWSSGFSSHIMRPIRSAFRVKILHRLDSANAKMLLDSPTSSMIRDIGSLKTGEAYYGDIRMRVPLLSEEDRKRAAEATGNSTTTTTTTTEDSNNWSMDFEESFIQTLLMKNKLNVDDLESIVVYWRARGYTKEEVLKLVRGNRTTIATLYDKNYDKNYDNAKLQNP